MCGFDEQIQQAFGWPVRETSAMFVVSLLTDGRFFSKKVEIEFKNPCRNVNLIGVIGKRLPKLRGGNKRNTMITVIAKCLQNSPILLPTGSPHMEHTTVVEN